MNTTGSTIAPQEFYGNDLVFRRPGVPVAVQRTTTFGTCVHGHEFTELVFVLGGTGGHWMAGRTHDLARGGYFLLRETDAPAHDIAASCGCRDSNYFSLTFHRLTGLTPSVFRERASGRTA